MTALYYCTALALVVLAIQTVMLYGQGTGVALISIAYCLLLTARHREATEKLERGQRG